MFSRLFSRKRSASLTPTGRKALEDELRKLKEDESELRQYAHSGNEKTLKEVQKRIKEIQKKLDSKSQSKSRGGSRRRRSHG